MRFQVADYMDAKLTKPATYDSVKKKLERQPRPSNSKYAQTVSVNNVIYKRLDKRNRAIDSGMRKTQELVVKAAVAASKTASRVIELLKSPDENMQALGQAMYDDVFDALCLSCQTSYQINMNRVSYVHYSKNWYWYTQQCIA